MVLFSYRNRFFTSGPGAFIDSKPANEPPSPKTWAAGNCAALTPFFLGKYNILLAFSVTQSLLAVSTAVYPRTWRDGQIRWAMDGIRNRHFQQFFRESLFYGYYVSFAPPYQTCIIRHALWTPVQLIVLFSMNYEMGVFVCGLQTFLVLLSDSHFDTVLTKQRQI